jgi:GNAT superfamily N-acetyltransferase
MHLTWRDATDSDLPLLANWNHQLIHEEGHRNAMTVPQLEIRMRDWLKRGEYRAIVFSHQAPVAHAVFKADGSLIHVRQFFVPRDHRRTGVGRAGVTLLRGEIWPPNVRLTVEVLCHNVGGIAFWRAMGYRDYGLTMEIMPQ